MKNKLFDVEIGLNGAMTKLICSDDAYKANCLLLPEDEPWMSENKQWGLGFVTSGHQRICIEECKEVKIMENKAVSRYELFYTEPNFHVVWNGDFTKSKIDRHITVLVTRKLENDGLYETFEFINHSDRYVVLDEVGIYSSFRDTYSVEKNALSLHFNQHICTCGDLCYIEAHRQNEHAPHVGLISLEGTFETYQLDDICNSNIRGVVALISKDVRIAAHQKKCFKRVIVRFSDRKEFQKKLCSYTGYPVMDYGVMTLEKGEDICISVQEKGQLSNIKIEGEILACVDNRYTYTPAETGVYQGRVKYDDKMAKITFKVIDSPKVLLKKRADFIVNHQQVNDREDPRYGAFVPYDIEREKMLKTEEAELYYHSVPDRNDARERMGMGAFLAAYARLTGDMSYLSSLLRYRDFLLKYIVDVNGDVWDSYLRRDSEKYYKTILLLVPQEHIDMRFRTFNSSFICPFFIEMYLLTKDIFYAEMAIKIMECYYKKCTDAGFMPNIFELKTELRKNGCYEFENRIRDIEKSAGNVVDTIRKTGENYEAGETAYEHGAPACNLEFLTSYYLVNPDEHAAEAINGELVRTLSFEGEQPHFNQNGIPIRHWDAYWFGKYEIWGDTMVHWISSMSACSYLNYYLMTGNKDYVKKAKKIFMSNLALINRDGSAYNSYIFNEKSNGRCAGRYDPLSNDQDWAYYYYLKCCERYEKGVVASDKFEGVTFKL